MKRLPGSIYFAAFMLVCSAGLAWDSISFKPPEVTSASEVQYPVRSIADGVVVLEVSLDANGGVAGMHVLRDIVSLTPAAIASVQSWKFKPASLKGMPHPSEMTIAVVFRPAGYLAAPPSFTPALPRIQSSSGGEPSYKPAGITSVAYPEYPVNSVLTCTVVVQLTINDAGKIEGTEVVRGVVPFTDFALGAAKRWEFQAAKLGQKTVASKVAIAFLFRPPLATQ